MQFWATVFAAASGVAGLAFVLSAERRERGDTAFRSALAAVAQDFSTEASAFRAYLLDDEDNSIDRWLSGDRSVPFESVRSWSGTSYLDGRARPLMLHARSRDERWIATCMAYAGNLWADCRGDSESVRQMQYICDAVSKWIPRDPASSFLIDAAVSGFESQVDSEVQHLHDTGFFDRMEHDMQEARHGRGMHVSDPGLFLLYDAFNRSERARKFRAARRMRRLWLRTHQRRSYGGELAQGR